ncbi:polysaccharide biosynthesis/export family protein [Gammaproteobacteria bacterium]|nr:polysaccharide biosynthesis/export family protein [Gammaproteobacteria bacterium]
MIRVALGDILRLSAWNEEALQQEVIVLPDGTISFPLVRIVNTSNRTPAEAWEELKNKLSRLTPDFEVNLAVSSTGGNNIFIISRVSRPRRFP